MTIARRDSILRARPQQRPRDGTDKTSRHRDREVGRHRPVGSHGLGSITPRHFFKELERAGSLEELVDKMRRLPSRARRTRELARLVWLEERSESPWPAMKRSNIAIVQPSCPVDYPDRGLQCQFALEPALPQLVQHAAESGWTKDEIASALLEGQLPSEA